MNIDTSWVKRSHENFQEETYDLRKFVLKQRKVEKVVMENTLNKFQSIFPELGNLNIYKLKKLLRENFHDYRVVETMRKIVNCICSVSQSTSDFSSGGESVDDDDGDGEDDSPVIDSSFYNWFTEFTKIDSNNVFGLIYKVVLSTEPEMLVIKTPADISNNDNLIHEAFVGYKLTNKLRRYIPNFMYVYGYHKINPPLELYGKIITGGVYDEIICCMYEYIPGKTLTKELPFLTKKEFISIILQLILATNLANEKFDWTHYDLHTGNIIIRRLKTPQSITYPFGDKTYTITTTVVPVIIDYGMSHVKYHNNSYGFNLGSGQSRPDKSFPMFDIYKLIMNCGSVLASNNRRLFKVCHQMYKYFNTVATLDEFEVSVREQKKYFFELPRSRFSTTVLTPYRHAQFIINLFPIGTVSEIKPNFNLIKMRYDHLFTIKLPPPDPSIQLTIPCFNDIYTNSSDPDEKRSLISRYRQVYRLTTGFNIDDIIEIINTLDALYDEIFKLRKAFFNGRRLKYCIEGYFEDAVFQSALNLKKYMNSWKMLYTRVNHLTVAGTNISECFNEQSDISIYKVVLKKLQKRERNFIIVHSRFCIGRDKLYDNLKTQTYSITRLLDPNTKDVFRIRQRLNYYMYDF